MKSKLLILGLGLIATAVVIALALTWLQAGTGLGSQNQPSGLARIFEEGPSAREAYALVEEWTASWAEDAQLVAASTSFERGGDGGSGWSFQLYSPQSRQLAVVMVEGGEVREINRQAALYPQNGVGADDWSVDNDAALTTWWAERGRDLWLQPGARTLTLHLGRRSDGRVTWQIVVLDEDRQLMDFWEMDASTGDRLESQTRGEE